MAKKDLQSQINEVLEVWDMPQQERFIRDVVPILDLYYNIGQDMEMFEKEENVMDAATVRLVRSAYLLSKLSERHSAKIATIKMIAPDLWRRMEKETNNGKETDYETETSRKTITCTKDSSGEEGNNLR